FLVVLIVCNHMERYSDAAIALVFAISPCADVMAFTFGKTLGKKLPAKMSPHVSPNKTLIGGFGGLIGGMIGAVCVFFFYYGLCQPVANGFDFANVTFEWMNLIFFIGIGVLTSAFSQFGDLVESAIKRKLDIKDMGKLLPGHGGILDRIDSSLYAGLIIALVFVIRLMTTG
ncbi:MAG: phosphatidate cytidylyltransferase, partial [Clostridia bacterium]|nr:phosphatidate cytidylyltransferase [Clostridia bacterium]